MTLPLEELRTDDAQDSRAKCEGITIVKKILPDGLSREMFVMPTPSITNSFPATTLARRFSGHHTLVISAFAEVRF
eukprot:6195277-Pleurochrysis_carterae.AAC.1